MLAGRTDPEAEAPILGPSHEKRRLPVGKLWRQEEKGTSEDEMVGQCPQNCQHEFDHNSGKQWKTGGPGMLWSMQSQRVRHDLMSKQ